MKKIIKTIGCAFLISKATLLYAQKNEASHCTQETIESSDSRIAWEQFPMVDFAQYYSSVYGPVSHGQYAHLFSPKDAASIMIDFGPNQFRLDLTWAHLLRPNQRYKLSAQHFSQSNTFDFVTLNAGEMVGQNVLGAEYEYAFSNAWTHTLVMQGYYFSANNGDLPSIPFSNDPNIYLDERTLVGAQGGGIGAGPRWNPWQGAKLELALNYDQVNFSTQTEPPKNSQGIGGTILFAQNLFTTVTFELMTTYRQPYHQYRANLSWVPYNKGTRQLGLQLIATHLNSDTLPATHENILGLNLSYRWDANTSLPRSNLSCFPRNHNCDLIYYSSRSAAYLPGVYVQRDENIVLQ